MTERTQILSHWMKEAFGQAEEALRQGETPVGAVFVAHPKLSDEDLNNGAKILVENWPYDFKKGRIVARGYNLTNKLRDVSKLLLKIHPMFCLLFWLSKF
jgi:hypothetical protein